MADIRINALATTAASTASDDFVAVDGSANGTRKLNAYSPTFGGNLTVSGTGNSTFSGNLNLNGTDKSILLNGASTQFSREIDVRIAGDTEGRLLIRGGGSLLWGDGAGGFDSTLARTAANMLTITGGLTTSGNLTVSGTGTSSVAGKLLAGSTTAPSGGSAQILASNSIGGGIQLTNTSSNSGGLINSVGGAGMNFYSYTGAVGSETYTQVGSFSSSGNLVLNATGADGGNGRLQLATHTTSAGGIGFGTDVSLYRSNAGYLTLLGTASLASQYFRVGSQNMGYLYFDTTDGYVSTSKAGASLVLRSGNEATALTLDSSQNATFAGKVAASVASGGTTALYGKATITSTSADNAIVWLGIGDQNSATRAGLVAYQSWNGTYTDYLAKITVLQGGVGGIDALTFGNTGNATFAGKVTANGAGSTFKGTATNDSAAAGYMGEYAETSTVYASRITLTTDTVANVASVSLTAGDWDVSGNVELEMSGVTSTDKRSGVSTTSASLTNNPDTCGVIDLPTTTLTGYLTIPTPTVRISIASTTTVYLPTKVTFSAGTTKAWGIIRARRVR